MVIYIIGVSGCGKSTVGNLLADKLKCIFYDGDHFHPDKNISKMASGRPLQDEDRFDWLISLNKLAFEKVKTQTVVIACSALKAHYRQILENNITDRCCWVYLKGDIETVKKRSDRRIGHFMPSELLQSQYDILEEPRNAITVDIRYTPEEITEKILNSLSIKRL